MARQYCVQYQLWLSDLCSVGSPAVTGGEIVERVLVVEEEAVVDDDRAVAAVVTDNLGWAGDGRGEHRQEQPRPGALDCLISPVWWRGAIEERRER